MSARPRSSADAKTAALRRIALAPTGLAAALATAALSARVARRGLARPAAAGRARRTDWSSDLEQPVVRRSSHPRLWPAVPDPRRGDRSGDRGRPQLRRRGRMLPPPRAGHQDDRRTMAASVLFAAGTVVNVAVGRLTFALGLAVALAALAAVRAGRRSIAAVLVLVTAPASPVAGVMLGLALTAWWLHTRRPALLVLAALAVTPVARRHGPVPAGRSIPVPGRGTGVVARRRRGRRARDRPPRRAPRRRALRHRVRGNVHRPQPAGRQRHSTRHVRRRARARADGPASASPARRGRPAGHHLVAVVAGVRRHRPRRPRPVGPRHLSPTADRRRTIGGSNERAGGDRADAAALGDGARRRGAPAGARVGAPARHGPQPGLLRDCARSRRVPPVRCATTRWSSWPSPTYRSTRPGLRRPISCAAGCPSSNRCGTTITGACGGSPTPSRWSTDQPGSYGSDPAAVVLDVAEAEPVLVRVRYSTHWSLDQAGCVSPSPDGWTIVLVVQPGVVTLRPVLARSLPIIGPLDGCPA